MKYKFIYLFAVSILFSATTFAQPANGNTKDALLKSGDDKLKKDNIIEPLSNMKKHIKTQKKKILQLK
ncbi:MAG: hypothetical protein IPO78_16905 [Saprospiraceae bacterium]|nr:hypothetical protein [Saprospiraceae bacterium]